MNNLTNDEQRIHDAATGDNWRYRKARMASAAWLNQIQIENSCRPDRPGEPCHSHKCGCALEQQAIIDQYASNITQAQEKS